MKITLTHPHHHDGTAYIAGATLDVQHGIAQWLIEQGMAQATTRVAPTPAPVGAGLVPAQNTHPTPRAATGAARTKPMEAQS